MFYLLLASFFWGTSFIAGKYAYTMADPSLVVLFRLIIASLITLPLTWRYLQQQTSSQTASISWKKIAFLGFLTYPVTFLFQFLGLSLTSASSAATVIGIEPLIVAISGAIFFKDKLSPSILLLGVMAFVGVALVVTHDQGGAVSLWGCTLVFFSTIAVAFWLRLSQQMLQKMDAKVFTALSIQLGTLVGLPLMLLATQDWQIHYSTKGIAAILYLGIGCSLVASWCWNKGLEKTPANVSGIFLALEPVFGVLLAVILLGETLSLTAIIGVVLVISAAGICILLPEQSQAV